MRALTGCLLLLMLSLNAFPQHFQDTPRSKPFTAADTSSLFFSIDNANFLKNNEYYNDYVAGYTRVGFFLEPSLTYILSERTSLSAGAHLLKFSGQDGFHRVRPVFTLKHRFSEGLQLIMGSLRTCGHHHLIDPIYHFENYLDPHVENGLQLLLDRPGVRSDLWINWKKFILPGDDFREQFEAGFSGEVALFGKGFSGSIPFQFLVEHQGGQIDQSDKPISTLLNGAGGVSLKYRTGLRWLRSITFRNLMVVFRDLSPRKLQPYSAGEALYSSLMFSRKNLNLQLSYWRAQDFMSFTGNPIFQSYSVKQARRLSRNRELITGRLNYTRRYHQLRFTVNLDSFWDPVNNSMDFGFGIYLLVNTDIFLTNTKPRK